jgi:hypothetical protein
MMLMVAKRNATKIGESSDEGSASVVSAGNSSLVCFTKGFPL